MKKTLFILLFLAFCSCGSRDNGIKSQWKYMKGFHFGDFLNLENKEWQISGDTIYRNSAPFAIIDQFKSTFYGAESKLMLRDIKSGRVGLYTDKGK